MTGRDTRDDVAREVHAEHAAAAALFDRARRATERREVNPT